MVLAALTMAATQPSIAEPADARISSVDSISLKVAQAAPKAYSPDPVAYIPNSVLVRYRGDASSTQVQSVQAELKAQVEHSFSLVPGLVQLRLPVDGPSVQQAVEQLSALPYVEYAEPDYILTTSVEPNDPEWGELWGMRNIRAPAAWNTFTGVPSLVVAIIDTGIDANHPDLAANIWTNANEIAGNGVDDDGNGFVDDIHGWDFYNGDNDPSDDHSHGTHTAGTVGAVGNNGIGVVGVTWRVRLMALKFIGSNGMGSAADAVMCLEYAVSMGAKVSNNSYGGEGYSQAMYDAIANARAIGHLFVASAGNFAEDNDIYPAYPASYDLDNVISVAAMDSGDDLAWFSNYGAATVDLGAPGVDVLSTLPGGNYGRKNGTSMAAPHVAGAVALLYGYFPASSYFQIRDRILGTARPVASLLGRTVTGGVLDLKAALDRGTPTPTPTRGTPTATPTATPTPSPILVNTTADRNGV